MRIVTEWAPSEALPEIPRTGAGAVLMQFRGEWEVASKLLYAETNRFGGAVVDGQDAFWTSGEYELGLVSGDRTRRLLVTGNVLIWQDAGFTYRLSRPALPKLAIDIAESAPAGISSSSEREPMPSVRCTWDGRRRGERGR